MKRITIQQLQAETGAQVRRARRAPVEIADHGRPIALITGTAGIHRDTFNRIRTLRSQLKLAHGETVHDLINTGGRR